MVETLELMPEPMYRALERIVGFVVDGEYEDLRAASDNRLKVEDLRRRVEDDCPESLVLPPRECYQVEAITKSDDLTCRAGRTSLTYGPRTARHACTSRANLTTRATRSRRH